MGTRQAQSERLPERGLVSRPAADLGPSRPPPDASPPRTLALPLATQPTVAGLYDGCWLNCRSNNTYFKHHVYATG